MERTICPACKSQDVRVLREADEPTDDTLRCKRCLLTWQRVDWLDAYDEDADEREDAPRLNLDVTSSLAWGY
jgi:hypothetical protein